MELDLVGLMTLLPLILIFFGGASRLPLGALSLPCITVMTSFIYFYLMPALAPASGDTNYFGMYLSPLHWARFAVLLYAIGALAAFLGHWRVLNADPSAPSRNERRMVVPVFYGLWVITAATVAAQILMGKLNLTGAANYELAADKELAFLTEAFNMMVPLTLLLLIRDNFKWRSLAFLGLVVFVFLQVGYRFRILIMLAAAVTSFAIVRRIKMRASYAFGGAFIAFLLANLIGLLRRYGEGLDLSRVGDLTADKVFSSEGEIGIVYVLDHVAENPLPDPVMFEPWLIAFARLVPSFIWPNKPEAEYLRYFISGMSADAEAAGVAAPQHVEMLLQFGWIGLPLLAFFYFTIAARLINRLHTLGHEARIAGCAIAPVFFGFYMQTRGYFFQIFSDSLFFFGPLFVVHLWE